MSVSERLGPGENRRLRSHVDPLPPLANPPEGGDEYSERHDRPRKLDRFMDRWIEMEQDKAQRIERQREEDQRNSIEQQDRWIRALTTATRSPIPIPAAVLLPRLTIPKFQEGVDDMGAFLEMFEVTAQAGVWPAAQWAVYLRSSLSGAGLSAITMLDATDQANYEVVKKVLLATYQVISETHRKLVFGQTLDITNPDEWLRKHRQNFRQWLRTSDKAPKS